MRLGAHRGVLTVNGFSVFPSDSVLERDYRQVMRLRFDPLNACNAECVFCGTSFPARPPKLNLEGFRRILRFFMANNLRFLDFGCGYEPLLAPNFEEVAQLLLEERVKEKVECLTLVTNGQLLHRKNMDTLAAAGLGMLHVSIHSHLQRCYEAVMRKGDLLQTASNVREFRRRYPHVRIKMVNVVTHLNKEDLPGYVRWGMDDLGVDDIVIQHAFWDAVAPPDSPMLRFVQKEKTDPNIPAEEWKTLVGQVEKLRDGYEVTVGESVVRAGANSTPNIWVKRKRTG